MDGTVRWARAEGTFELSYGSLTADGQAQLCTTGPVEWTARRRGSSTVAPVAKGHPNVTFVDIDGDGGLMEAGTP